MILPLGSIPKGSDCRIGRAMMALASELPVAPASITVAIPRMERA